MIETERLILRPFLDEDREAFAAINADPRVADWLGGANGAFTQNWANIAARVPLSWSVEAVGDYNGDGKDDILWRSDTGRTTDWLGTGAGAFTANWDNAHSGIATSWHVQPGDALI